jgi:hypothetical protein
MSHPAWYSTVWQTYDYDLDVNGAYYGARKAASRGTCRPTPTWRVRAVNHTGAIAAARTMGARCSRSGSWRRSGRR